MATTEIPIVTGYYRYTDIWFQSRNSSSCLRPDVLPPCDRDPLKAVLSHDALVHPDHPLHLGAQDPGISLFIGMRLASRTNLIVDFIRYWLLSMKLTAGMIPLPYSDCLLTLSELKTVAPVTYKDGGSLRGAVKMIEKNNKRLKNANPGLTARRDAFERVRKFWAAKIGTWCSIDFEAWERDSTVITEFGYSSIRWSDGAEVKDCGHLTIKEHKMYTNGVYVPEYRNHYNFGESVEVSKAQLRAKISRLVSKMHTNGPVFLVFHDYKQDVKTLETLGAPLDGAVIELPDAIPSEGIFIVDTTTLFGALEGESNNKRSLKQVCNHLQIHTDFLHNAGNDAYYTLLALREMASGDPLDTQREIRWPNRTGDNNAGVKVKFTPYEEDSDFSDQEGVMGGYNPSTGVLDE
ncbi:hypothetical protein B0H15DRAFT_830457 [Mycena belliarum]|uniref:Gfd2/YDR514C-like C-terminal domain-containing protein n=1 Tax=Mycena belliarum TaxID=1033014 RepID=A0AAD6XTL5_9AGAR|nr:hypothetical protein B0H15DRAFT_830457 [Mycena belliae]